MENAARVRDLLRKLHVIYGRNFYTATGGAPIETMEQEWIDELGGFSFAELQGAIKRLRDHYKEWPPTLYQFRDLCLLERRILVAQRQKLSAPREEPPPGVLEKLKATVAAWKYK